MVVGGGGGQARHNSSNVGGVTAGQVGHNSSTINDNSNYCGLFSTGTSRKKKVTIQYTRTGEMS